MYLKNESIYLEGLVNMASSCSKRIGLSYMDAMCFPKNNYISSFSKYYDVPLEEVSFHQSNISFKKKLISILGDDKKLIDGLIFWIEKEAGECKHIYELDDNSKLRILLSRSDGGCGAFYFLEDVFMVEFDKMIIYFMYGNDE